MLPSGTKQGVPVLIGSSSVDEINKPALVTRLPANKPKHLHTGLNTHTQRHTRVQACSFTKHEPMHAHEHTNNYKRASTHATHTHTGTQTKEIERTLAYPRAHMKTCKHACKHKCANHNRMRAHTHTCTQTRKHNRKQAHTHTRTHALKLSLQAQYDAVGSCAGYTLTRV